MTEPHHSDASPPIGRVFSVKVLILKGPCFNCHHMQTKLLKLDNHALQDGISPHLSHSLEAVVLLFLWVHTQATCILLKAISPLGNDPAPSGLFKLSSPSASSQVNPVLLPRHVGSSLLFLLFTAHSCLAPYTPAWSLFHASTSSLCMGSGLPLSV